MNPALSPPPPSPRNVAPGHDPFATLAQGLFAMQNAQVETLLAWQSAFAAANQELWDQWVTHWGGGAPIDV